MIDVSKELDEAHARLPVQIPDGPLPLQMQMRSMALTIAARYVGDTCVREGGLYQQLKMDNKLGNAVSLDDVMRTALVFERYLWGEFSRGIVENALSATSTEVADAIEEEMDKHFGKEVEDGLEPIRPSAGSGP